MEGLVVGRIVHYTDSKWGHQAAIVIRVLDKERGVVSLNTFRPDTGATFLVPATVFGNEANEGTWHWPERD